MLTCQVSFKGLLTGLLDPQKFEAANLREMVKAAKMSTLATEDVAIEGKRSKTKAHTWNCNPASSGHFSSCSFLSFQAPILFSIWFWCHHSKCHAPQLQPLQR